MFNLFICLIWLGCHQDAGLWGPACAPRSAGGSRRVWPGCGPAPCRCWRWPPRCTTLENIGQMFSVYKAELPRQSSYSLQLKLFLPWALSSRLIRESLLMSSVGQSLSSQWVMSVMGLIDENMAPVNSRGLIRNLLVCVHDPLLPCKEVMNIQPPTFHTIHLSWAPQNISNWIWDTQKPRPVASESVLVLFSSFSSWTLSSSWTWFLPVVVGWRRNGESHACLCEASWQGPSQSDSLLIGWFSLRA